MSNKDAGDVIALMVLALLAAGVGSLITHKASDALWKEAAAQHGAAEYDQKTGAWRWKDQAEERE